MTGRIYDDRCTASCTAPCTAQETLPVVMRSTRRSKVRRPSENAWWSGVRHCTCCIFSPMILPCLGQQRMAGCDRVRVAGPSRVLVPQAALQDPADVLRTLTLATQEDDDLLRSRQHPRHHPHHHPHRVSRYCRPAPSETGIPRPAAGSVARTVDPGCSWRLPPAPGRPSGSSGSPGP
jgi:hypothetical protein